MMEYQIHQCVASRLRRLSRIADSYLRKSLTDFNITENQMNILFVLHETNQIEQGTIGKMLYLERSTVSRAMKLLITKGYVNRTEDYQPLIQLTAIGHDLVNELMPVWTKYMDSMCQLMGTDGLDHISGLEIKLVKN